MCTEFVTKSEREINLGRPRHDNIKVDITETGCGGVEEHGNEPLGSVKDGVFFLASPHVLPTFNNIKDLAKPS
jgi:hypothetical protein